MLLVVFNIETRNYYSKSTFNMTLIKQEKLVFILVIVYIQQYLCVFIKLFTGTRASEDFQYQVTGSRNNRKCTALVVKLLTLSIFPINNFDHGSGIFKKI